MNRRSLLLGGALLVSLAWSAWLVLGEDGGGDVVQAVARGGADTGARRATAPRTTSTGAVAPSARKAAPAAPNDRSAGIETGQRPAPPRHPRNLFASYTYEAPKPKVVAAPEAPHAPPLPFTYAGRLVANGRTTFLLMHGEATIGMVIGAESDGFKLVEASARQLVFLHGATGQRVTLRTSATS